MRPWPGPWRSSMQPDRARHFPRSAARLLQQGRGQQASKWAGVKESFGEECAQLLLGGTLKPLQYIQRMAPYGRHRTAAAFEFCTIHDASPSSSRVSLGVSARAGGHAATITAEAGERSLYAALSCCLWCAATTWQQHAAATCRRWPSAVAPGLLRARWLCEPQYEGAANHWWLRPWW